MTNPKSEIRLVSAKAEPKPGNPKQAQNSNSEIRNNQRKLVCFVLRVSDVFRASSFGFRALQVRRGFTLIELILYIGITAMVVVALTRAMLTILGTRERVESVSSVQQELRFVMDRLTYVARGAVAVETGASLFGTGHSVLALSVRGEPDVPVIFSLSGSAIVMREGTGGVLPLTSRRIIVDELLFEPLTASGGSVVLSIRMHARNAAPELRRDDADEMTLETAVTLRQ